MDLETSGNTARARESISVPAERLLLNGLVVGRTLDYGCGNGADMWYLKCEGYDPMYLPLVPKGKFDTVLCTYVLNTIPQGWQKRVLHNLELLLKKGGKAYITVRRDVPRRQTKSQRYVRLNKRTYPVLWETSRYCTYVMERK